MVDNCQLLRLVAPGSGTLGLVTTASTVQPSDGDPEPEIRIRLLGAEDRKFFASLAKDPRVVRFVGDGQPWTDERIDARVQQAIDAAPQESIGAARWFVASDRSASPGFHDDRVGLIVAWRTEDGVEVGYWVRPSAWGRGIAGSMVAKVLPRVVEIFGTDRPLRGLVRAENLASVKVLARCGFIRTGEKDGYDVYTLDPQEIGKPS